MWLQAPKDIETVLWTGPMEPETDETVEQVQQNLAGLGFEAEADNLFRNPPLVSIGQPETWLLQDLYPSKEMPPAIQSKLDEADFYLIRLVCSLNPARRANRIASAQFLVHLVPDSAGQQPLAYDLHPREVTQEVKHQVKFSLSPSLSFEPVEIGGGLEYGIEYPELQPIVTASGIGEKWTSWGYEETRGIRLQGTKVMHLLIKAPRGMSSGEAALSLRADLDILGILSARMIVRKEAPALKVRLWG
jgi:hypothetical protein